MPGLGSPGLIEHVRDGRSVHLLELPVSQPDFLGDSRPIPLGAVRGYRSRQLLLPQILRLKPSKHWPYDEKESMLSQGHLDASERNTPVDFLRQRYVAEEIDIHGRPSCTVRESSTPEHC